MSNSIMITFIQINETQANELRGTYGTYHTIDPIQLRTGEYILSTEIIENPAYSEIFNILSELPTYLEWNGDNTNYIEGDIREFNDKLWRCIRPHTSLSTWEPGVAWSLWTIAHIDNVISEWIQPQGSHDTYPLDSLVIRNNQIWKSLINDNVWEPGIIGSENLWVLATDDTEEIPDEPDIWVQPQGAHDSYPLNAQVTHKDQVWISGYNNNVWEPGVFGWTVVL